MTAGALTLPKLEQRFIFRDADWDMYQGFLDLLGQRPVRLTYDRGVLELMTLSFGHERFAELIGDFVAVMTDELDMPRQNGGSTTFNRQDLDRGLEPDKCFYLQNEPLVRGKDEIDLAVDPPPDLAVEIDISRSSIDRLTIYAALRVPEVWRFDGEELTVYRLNAAGDYEQTSTSSHFPRVPLAEIVRHLKLADSMDQTKLVRAFRQSIREHFAR
jgi:Uma2 family endonuclease